MMDEEELEAFNVEGHVLVNDGLDHLRTVLNKQRPDLYAAFAWLRGTKDWLDRLDGMDMTDEQFASAEAVTLFKIAENLNWLQDRLTPKAPDGKPFDFIVDNTRSE